MLAAIRRPQETPDVNKPVIPPGPNSVEARDIAHVLHPIRTRAAMPMSGRW